MANGEGVFAGAGQTQVQRLLRLVGSHIEVPFICPARISVTLPARMEAA